MWRMLTAIGMTGNKTTTSRMGEAAEIASYWLWSRREDVSWKSGRKMGMT